jgi:hypothetical protein
VVASWWEEAWSQEEASSSEAEWWSEAVWSWEEASLLGEA